jgi:hypothetical protein
LGNVEWTKELGGMGAYVAKIPEFLWVSISS